MQEYRAQERKVPLMESGYSVIFRNGFAEILFVLNHKMPDKMIQREGAKGLYGGFDSIEKRKGWGCPGGGMEKSKGDVTVRDTAFRETEEETSIRVVINEDAAFVSTPVRDNYAKTYFLVERFEGTPVPNQKEEVIAVDWVPVEVFLMKDDREEVFYKGDPIYKGHRRMIRDLLRAMGVIKD